MKYTCSVILPTYNEAENIGDLIKEILKCVPTAEIIVVDDDSPDKTWQIAQQLKKKNVRVIRRFERGLPSAIARGIKDHEKGEKVNPGPADPSIFHPKRHTKDQVIGPPIAETMANAIWSAAAWVPWWPVYRFLRYYRRRHWF